MSAAWTLATMLSLGPSSFGTNVVDPRCEQILTRLDPGSLVERARHDAEIDAVLFESNRFPSSRETLRLLTKCDPDLATLRRIRSSHVELIRRLRRGQAASRKARRRLEWMTGADRPHVRADALPKMLRWWGLLPMSAWLDASQSVGHLRNELDGLGFAFARPPPRWFEPGDTIGRIDAILVANENYFAAAAEGLGAVVEAIEAKFKALEREIAEHRAGCRN